MGSSISVRHNIELSRPSRMSQSSRMRDALVWSQWFTDWVWLIIMAALILFKELLLTNKFLSILYLASKALNDLPVAEQLPAKVSRPHKFTTLFWLLSILCINLKNHLCNWISIDMSLEINGSKLQWALTGSLQMRRIAFLHATIILSISLFQKSQNQNWDPQSDKKIIMSGSKYIPKLSHE